MSHHVGEQFPKRALYGAAALIGMTLTLVFGIRLGVLPAPVTTPEARAEARVSVISARDFRFSDRADGALVVTDAASGGVAMVLEPGSNSGFIRGVMRGMMRERRLNEVARDGAVRITQWADGALTLEDKSTGRILELGSFGSTNRASFAQLLARGPQSAGQAAPQPGQIAPQGGKTVPQGGQIVPQGGQIVPQGGLAKAA